MDLEIEWMDRLVGRMNRLRRPDGRDGLIFSGLVGMKVLGGLKFCLPCCY
jgi:hypothetical protein